MAKKYLTFEDICALPLIQQATQHEEERHRARMLEIQTMTKALGALQLERAEILRNGYRLFGESIMRGAAKPGLVYTGCMGQGDEIRLATALLRSGWKVVDRDGGLYPSPTFRKGRVNLKMSCWHEGSLEKAERQVAASSSASAVALATAEA